MGFRLTAAIVMTLSGLGAAEAQVRIAPPEASGVARREGVRQAAPPSASPAVARASSRRTVVTRTPTFVVGGSFFTDRYLYSRRFVGPIYPPYDYRYGFRPAYCSCGGLLGDCGCAGPYYLPPVFADAGQAFGPRAAMRFLIGDNVAPNVVANVAPVVNPVANPVANRGPILPPEPRLRPFNDQARGRAWKFIDYGDKQFRAGKHREAIQRYRKAAATDSGLGEALFRQGWAELARGDVGRASVAFRRGLQIDTSWPASDFVLEELLDGDARQTLFKALADSLAAAPNDIDARFVQAVARHFDGDPAAARRDFTRVLQQTGGDPAAQAFLPRVEPEQDAEQQADG